MESDTTPPPEDEQPATSLSPIEVEPPSFDLEVASMRKGNGAKLVAITVACATVIGISVLLLGDLDSREEFVQAGTHMNKLHKSGYERFWNCALIGMNQAQVESGEQVKAELDKRARHFGRSYAALMRKCGTSLDALERDLDTMQTPSSLKQPVRSMRVAIGATRHATAGLIEHVEQQGSNYTTEAGDPYVHKLAQAWEKYRESHLLFRNAIREQL